jgi:crotonobetainyl-CoA:carnitine CoA-transferase CaiB-like acyl-CoA transferase
VHAEGGLVARQMEMNGTPPLDQIISTADVLASLHGLVGLLAASADEPSDGTRSARGHRDAARTLLQRRPRHFRARRDRARASRGEVWDTASGQIIISGAFQWVWKTLSRHQG